MRAELFQVLQRVSNSVDCGSSVASGTAPAAALNKKGGGVLVPAQGANFGRFSVVANVNSLGSGFEILAASFISPPANPRNELAADTSKFAKKKIGGGNWSWSQTGDLISKSFSEFQTICDVSGTSASTSTFPLANFSCPSGRYVGGFDSSGKPICNVDQQGSTTIISSTSSSGSSSAASKWNLDRDCVADGQAGVPAPAPHCKELTSMTCPADPGGLSCSSPGSYCITPTGYRRFKCS